MPDSSRKPSRKDGYVIAVIGATGSVGREILQILWDRNFPASQVIALASERSAGREISFGEDDVLKVENLETFDFKGVDIALSSPGAKVSAVNSPRAAAAGCVVIDNTSHFRMDPDVPLVVPEVNPGALARYKKRGIIANPNCSTIQMVVAPEAAARCVQNQTRCGVHLSIHLGCRQGRHGRAVQPDQGHLCQPGADRDQVEVHQADRFQCYPACFPIGSVHGRRLHQGGMEIG